jgi:hypothetical protein
MKCNKKQKELINDICEMISQLATKDIDDSVVFREVDDFVTTMSLPEDDQELVAQKTKSLIWVIRRNKKGNEHLLNTNHPTNSLPVPEPKLPTFDNEKKRYRVAFGNEEVYCTDQELYNFITGAVIHNRDIGLFTVMDTVRIISR